jgi:hypothetical protein
MLQFWSSIGSLFQIKKVHKKFSFVKYLFKKVIFKRSNKWLCNFNEYNYVNIRNLINFLSKFDHGIPWFISNLITIIRKILFKTFSHFKKKVIKFQMKKIGIHIKPYLKRISQVFVWVKKQSVYSKIKQGKVSVLWIYNF